MCQWCSKLAVENKTKRKSKNKNQKLNNIRIWHHSFLALDIFNSSLDTIFSCYPMFTCHSVPASIQVSCFEMQIEHRRVGSMLCVANQFSITIIRFRAHGFYDAEAGAGVTTVVDDVLSVRKLQYRIVFATYTSSSSSSIIVFVMCVNWWRSWESERNAKHVWKFLSQTKKGSEGRGQPWSDNDGKHTV